MSLIDLFRGNIPNKESIKSLQEKVDKLYKLFGIPEDDSDSDINMKAILSFIEESEIQQSQMKDEIRELKSEIELLQEKNSYEQQIEKDRIAITNEIEDVPPNTDASLKQQEGIAKKYCYMEPSRSGEFAANAKLRSTDENDRDAFYVILEHNEDDLFAEFYPVKNKLERLLMSKEDILDPVCIVQGSSGAGKLTIISNGKLKKEDSKWVLLDKCVIELS